MSSTFTVQLTNPKFRITIPSDVRDAENIQKDDFLEVTVTKKQKPTK